MDTKKLSTSLSGLKTQADSFFSRAEAICTEEESDLWTRRNESPKTYWDQLPQDVRSLSQASQEALLNTVSLVIPTIKSSPVLDESDEKDIGRCIKRMRAALKLRNYRSWDIEVLHDEGAVLGVNPPGQSENEPSSPSSARTAFNDGIEQLEGIVQLLRISPSNISDGLPFKNPNLTQNYRPNTAFIMMAINHSAPESIDVYDAYKDCFAKFGINAVRADEIEHEDIITKRIIEEIRTSEFLVGDLTHERPSVYYEIGYAHSLGRRVILYRKSETPIHFDLAAYNCPEYKNIKELKSFLLKRLEEATNRKPEN